jgi:hypothetical protein
VLRWYLGFLKRGTEHWNSVIGPPKQNESFVKRDGASGTGPGWSLVQRDRLKGPTGSPDHHRGLHKHHIRGGGPLLFLLSLISYSKLAFRHHLRFPSSYFWESYSKRYFPVMGGSSPLSLPPSTSQAPSLEEHKAKGQEEKGR